MNEKAFKELVELRYKDCMETLGLKAAEYASDEDRLYNFRRAGEFKRETPEEALWGMLVKHLVSVVDIIEGTQLPNTEILNEKFRDVHNYFYLLEALIVERKLFKS